MKSFLLGGIALAALTATAAAQQPQAFNARAASASYNWTGFYVGGNAGAGRNATDWTWHIMFPAPDTTYRAHNSQSGFVGGAHAGFLYQWSSLVTGAEISWSYANLNSSFIDVFNAFKRTFEAKVNSIVTATARLGIANGQWLAYAKGGYASADVKLNTSTTITGVSSTTSSKRDHGWTAGGGLEYGLTPNWILGLEYNYLALNGGDRLNVNIAPTAPSNHEHVRTTIQTVLGRVSYKFGSH